MEKIQCLQLGTSCLQCLDLCRNTFLQNRSSTQYARRSRTRDNKFKNTASNCAASMRLRRNMPPMARTPAEAYVFGSLGRPWLGQIWLRHLADLRPWAKVPIRFGHLYAPMTLAWLIRIMCGSLFVPQIGFHILFATFSYQHLVHNLSQCSSGDFTDTSMTATKYKPLMKRRICRLDNLLDDTLCASSPCRHRGAPWAQGGAPEAAHVGHEAYMCIGEDA